MVDFLLFLFVGFLAQIVDGALGMAYGVISSTVLLSFGVPPAMASASVHAAEVFTTAASAGSHAVNKNVNWKLFAPLAEPRISVGTANTAEFFVTSTISAAFLAALLSGHWEQADGLASHATSVLGLVVGGLVAAPFAGIIVKIAPARLLTYAVGTVVLGLAGYQTLRLVGVL